MANSTIFQKDNSKKIVELKRHNDNYKFQNQINMCKKVKMYATYPYNKDYQDFMAYQSIAIIP